jgi:hypothetical protein
LSVTSPPLHLPSPFDRAAPTLMSVTYAQPATPPRSPPRALAPRVRSGRVRPWHHVPAGGVHARAQDLECAVDNYSDQHRKHCLPHRQGPHAQRPRLTAYV